MSRMFLFLYLLPHLKPLVSITAVTCPDPTSPANGYIEVSQYSGQYEYGSVATYHCNPGYTLDTAALTRAVCGEGGAWQTDRRGEGEGGVWVSHQGTTVTPAPRCLPLSCSSPPLLEHTVLELLNETAGPGSLLVYQCEAGYRDLSYPGGVTVSQCQTDTTWSPVNITCVFDPAAVASNILEYDRGDDKQDPGAMELSTIITIVSISVAFILSLMIIFVVIKHRRMREKLVRSRKFSKITAGGVKVLPDYLFSPTPLESHCKERPRSSISIKDRDQPEDRGASPTEVLSKLPAAPDVTINCDTTSQGGETLTSDFSDHQAEGEADDSKIYESLNTLEAEAVQPDLKALTLLRRDKRPDTGLYAKVKKLSGASTQSAGPNCPNLNSDFVSIYELTKVESHQAAPFDGDDLQQQVVSPAVEGDSSDTSESYPQTKTKSNFSFALDFSAKREINKVSFASFNPDNDEDILNVTNDEGYEFSNGIDHTSDDDQNCNSNKTSNIQSLYKHKIENFPVQSEPIAKMQMNMFIQKDGKRNGSKKWPKVETPFCRQNRVAEVRQVIIELNKVLLLQASTSPTKSLIERYNTGLVKADENFRFHNELGRKSNTKKLINKWNNPEKLNKAPPSGGFQVSFLRLSYDV